jgi:hypothetical protein
MNTIQTPARVTSTPCAPAPGATDGAGWGSPSGETQRRQPSVAPSFDLDFDLARGRLPWLTVRFPSTGPEPRPTSPAHPAGPTTSQRVGHRAGLGRGASCACEHRRGRGAGPSGRGGP